MGKGIYNAEGIVINEIKTVFDLLNLVEKHPREYLGGVENSDSYAALVAYLNALEYSRFFDETPSSLREFKDWAHREHSCRPAECFYNWLEREVGPERAFEEFFLILKRYKIEQGITA